MCLIIDVNVAASVFCTLNDPVFGVVRDALYNTNRNRAICMVSGGKLQSELCQNGHIARCLLELDRAGRLKKIPAVDVQREVVDLQHTRRLRSNDPHIVALARLSGARVLCSADTRLRQDFKDKHLISNPRGRVFTSPTQAHLLKTCCLNH